MSIFVDTPGSSSIRIFKLPLTPKAVNCPHSRDPIGGGVLVWRKGSFKLRAWSHQLKSTQVLLFRAGDSLEWLAIARSAYSLCMLVIKRCRLHECEPNV